MPIYQIYKTDGTPVQVEAPEGASFNQLATLAAKQPTISLEEEQEQQRLIASQAPLGFLGGARELLKGTLGGIPSTVELGLLGAAAALPEQTETRVREGIQSVFEPVKKQFAPRLNAMDAVPRKFGEALGSFAAIGAASAVNPRLGVGLAAGLGAGEASERAREFGATPEQRAQTLVPGALVGLSEVIAPSRIVSQLLPARQLKSIGALEKAVGKGPVREAFARIAREGTIEGAQEAAAGFAQNLIAQRVYNPEQGSFTNTLEDFGYGAGVGSFVQGILELAIRDRGARATATQPAVTEEQPAAPEEQLRLPSPPRQITDARGQYSGVAPNAPGISGLLSGPPNISTLMSPSPPSPETSVLSSIIDLEGKDRDAPIEEVGLGEQKLVEDLRGQYSDVTPGPAPGISGLLSPPPPPSPETFVVDPEGEAKSVPAGELGLGLRGERKQLEDLRAVYAGVTPPPPVDRKEQLRLPPPKVKDLTYVTDTTGQALPVQSEAIGKFYNANPLALTDKEQQGITIADLYTVPEPGFIESLVKEAKGAPVPPPTPPTPDPAPTPTPAPTTTSLSQKDFSGIADALFKNLKQSSKVPLSPVRIKYLNDNLADFKSRKKRLGDKPDTELNKSLKDFFEKEKEKIVEQDKLPTDKISGTSVRLSGATIDSLSKGNLSEALLNLSKQDKVSFEIKNVALYLSGEVDKNKTKISVNQNMSPTLAGSFNESTNTVEINPNVGFNAHVLLHEVGHSVVQKTINNKSNPLTAQLNTLFNDVKDSLDTMYGSTSLKEFVAETFSNPDFQKKLASINVKGEPITALQRFFNAVVNFLNRVIFNRPAKPLTALESANTLLEALISPTASTVGVKSLLANSVAPNAKKLLGKLSDVQNNIKNSNISRASFIANGFDFVFNNRVSNKAKELFLGFADGLTVGELLRYSDFSKEGKNLGILANKYMNESRGRTESARKKFRKINERISELEKKIKQSNPEGLNILNKIIYDLDFGATLYGVDPSKPRAEYLDKTDTSGNKKVDVWDKIHAYLDANTNNITEKNQILLLEKEIRNYYVETYADLKKVIGTSLVEETVGEGEKAEQIKTDLINKILNIGSVDVYHPLVRKGKYGISYKLKTIAELQKDNIPIPAGFKDPTSLMGVDVYEKVDSINEQGARIKELEADPFVITQEIRGYDSDDQHFSGMVATAPTSFVARLLTELRSKPGLDPDTVAAIEKEVQDLYISILPETSLAKQVRKRTRKPGFDGDALEAFRTKGLTLSLKVAQLQGNAELRRVQADLNKAYNEYQSKRNKIQRADRFSKRAVPDVGGLVNDIKKRINFAMNGAPNKRLENTVKTANQTAFLFTIGFNISSAVVNLSQIPLFAYPYLSARYGAVDSFKAVTRASKFVAGSSISIDKYFDEQNQLKPEYENLVRERYKSRGKQEEDARVAELQDYATLVSVASRQGQLTNSYLFDALGLQEQRNLLDKLTGVSAFFFNQAERFNRQAVLMATYKLSLDQYKKKNPNQPVTEEIKIELAENAINETQRLNSGTVLETGSRYAQTGLGRIALMYKNYGIRMYTTMLTSSLKAISNDPNLSAEEKKIARKELIYVTGSSVFFAGAQGIPIYGAIELISNLFLLDDEEEDFDMIVRKRLGEVALKGPINEITGLNISDRVRLSGLLIQENKFNQNQGLEESFIGFFGGPAFGTIKKGVIAFRDFKDGKILRGIETALPTAVGNIFKTARVAGDDGFKTRRGDYIYDDVTGGEIAGQLFGFPPAEYSRRQEEKAYLKKVDIAVSKRRSKLTREYYQAYRDNNFDRQVEALEKIDKFNQEYRQFSDLIITSETIRKSIARQEQTSKEMKDYNGVAITNKQLIDDLRLLND